MACLNITPGLFINILAWQAGNANTPNGATVTLNPGGASPGCTVSKGADTEFFAMPVGGTMRFLVFGNPANFVAILSVGGGVGPQTRSVTIVDVSGTTLSTQTLFCPSAPTTASLPAIHPSQGNGSVFMLFAPDGSGPLATVSTSIHRSVDGMSLVSAVPFSPSLQVLGNATTTQLQILEGATVRASAALPSGECNALTNPVNFPEAVVGAGVPPAMSTSTRSTIIRNDGNDCLTINSVGNNGPYTVIGSTPAMPVVLDPGQQMTVDIRFAPTAAGTFNVDLPINPTPAAPGTSVISCRGRARNAVRSITFSAALTFGTVPLAGAGSTRNLVVTNNGDLPVNLTIPSTPIPGGEFALTAAGFVGAIAPGASTPAIPITFTPTVEGPITRALTFTSDVPGSPHTVNLSGTGCVARARINIITPPGPTIALGQVQRGFRTVKLIRVQNTGNGSLSFDARIVGNSLFGIQRDGGSITAPSASTNFTVAPVAICGAGPTGIGDVLFAVTFFADAVPGTQTGQLVIDNHNAQFGAPASFTFNLEAEVIAAVNADVELVIDRSGSMSDASGPRRKIDTALDAARLFVQLARPDVDDRFGASRFNTLPEQVQSMTAITAVNQPGMVNGFIEANYSPGGGTSIAGGVIQALRDMSANPRAVAPPQLNRAVVVLTDANDNTPYLNPDDGRSYTLLGESGTTAIAVPPDVRLYGVGIGDDVDVGRLAQLCPTTGGDYLHVRDFSGLDFFKLEKHFTQIYMATVNLAQISDPTFWIQPNQEHEHKFDVLRGDVSIMVVIYDRDQVRLPFWLVTPKGERIELTSVPAGFQIRPGITSTARFIEVRLPQGDPDRYAGEWKVVIRHDGKFCTAPGVPMGSTWWDGTNSSSIADSSIASGSRTHALGSHQQEQWQGAYGFTTTKCKEAPNDPAMYGIAIGAGSNFRMFPFVEPAVVKVGDPIRLNALVSEYSLPVLNCIVTVDATAPDGSVTSMTLHDNGLHQDGAVDDGDYGGSYLRTSQEGMYEFLFRAHGQSRDGEPVTREATLSKYVEGRTPLVPPPTGGNDSKDECCRKLQRWLWLFAILLLILIVVVWRTH